jgi:uncharacterized surface protein with fasciclin (FAS1) repeats
MNDLNEYALTDGWPVPITRLNDLNEFKMVRFGGDREMNQISKSSSSPNASAGGRQNDDPALQIAACTKLIRSQSLIMKKEFVMSLVLKSSVAFSVAALLLASSSVAEAGKKCAGTTVTTVALKKEAKMDIVDTAVNAGSFKTLAAALQAAGLVDTLKGKGPFTVFAPTDEAFAKLPAGTVETLLKPENKAKLAGILTYHVVSGNVKAADVVKLTSAKTVQGQTVAIDAKDGVKINNAKVVKADIETSNGVIHVIDTVLLPKE